MHTTAGLEERRGVEEVEEGVEEEEEGGEGSIQPVWKGMAQ